MPPYSDGLQAKYRHGFIYSDCRADDARLVIANAQDAQMRGAKILPRTTLVSAQRLHSHWQVTLSNGQQIAARAIVNAAGPWVKEVLNNRLQVPSNDAVRLVRGSHLVMPKLYEGAHAFILQNDDRRVIFMIPYEGRFTLVGTTDVAETGDPSRPVATDAEAEYLCRAIGRYLARVPQPQEALLRFAGVRPLYDDGSGDPSSITRDYTLRLDHENDAAPVLSIFGGKLTTYRRLAEQVVDKIADYFPEKLSNQNSLPQSGWTGKAVLPGGDLGEQTIDQYRAELATKYPWLAVSLCNALFRRHGSRIHELLEGARSADDLGENFGGDLTEREVDWFRSHEWATTTEDILWRRSKCGLHMSNEQRAVFSRSFGDA
jgi:glycerol-3-phosphate dehydrogenase